jgi:hypothetical protein
MGDIGSCPYQRFTPAYWAKDGDRALEIAARLRYVPLR